MGTLLLQRWSMLGESCKSCHVPLMRSPDKRIGYCTYCKRQTQIGKRATVKKENTLREIGPEKILAEKIKEANNAQAPVFALQKTENNFEPH